MIVRSLDLHYVFFFFTGFCYNHITYDASHGVYKAKQAVCVCVVPDLVEHFLILINFD